MKHCDTVYKAGRFDGENDKNRVRMNRERINKEGRAREGRLRSRAIKGSRRK